MDLSPDAELYRKHADELIRFATALAGPSMAEDVLAAGVTSALASPGWAAVENRRAYLFRCVASEAMRTARSAQRRLRRERRLAPREAVEDQVLDRDVLTAMLALSTRQRAVVYLTYWHGLIAVEVAESVGCSERTVERELERSRLILERKLS
jgi:RNA polymerase sigma factor (sigma-70 family)